MNELLINSLKEYGAMYNELGSELQQKIRKAYPMVLSEALVDG